MFTLPIALLGLYLLKKEAARKRVIFLSSLIGLHCLLFIFASRASSKTLKVEYKKKNHSLFRALNFVKTRF